MANVIDKLEDIELFLADIVCDMIGLEQENVLIQYVTEGQPSFDIEQDICFVKVAQEIDERDIYKTRKMVYNKNNDNFDYKQYSQRTLNAHFIFYGPNCYELCKLLNESFYFPNFEYIINNNNLYLVPDRTVGPNRVPELYNGRWWQRSDLELRFYNSVVVETNVDRIVEADIRLEADK